MTSGQERNIHFFSHYLGDYNHGWRIEVSSLIVGVLVLLIITKTHTPGQIFSPKVISEIEHANSQHHDAHLVQEGCCQILPR